MPKSLPKDFTKTYTNGDITVVWKPGMCIHSGICFTGLPTVFDPKKRPWVNPNGAETERIANQVDKCPSKALSYFYNDQQPKPESVKTLIIEPLPDGPLMIHGEVVVRDSDGRETKKTEVTAFCRCGASNAKPYCDGSHVKVKFKAA